MKLLAQLAVFAALGAPIGTFAAEEPLSTEPVGVPVAENSTAVVGAPSLQPQTEQAAVAPAVAEQNVPIQDAAIKASDLGSDAVPVQDSIDAKILALESAAARGDLQAAVALGVKHSHAEGVPKDPKKALALFCGAARYGFADGLFNLGWVYAHGRGVERDDAVAAELFRRAADRGHEHATKMLAVVQEPTDVSLPACMAPAALPVAVALPPKPVLVDLIGQPEPQVPMAPKEITQLVQKLAPQYGIDSNLALAVIYAESAFNSNALSPANAQGLMQLIPETAERFGVKKPFNPDENIKGGLAYLRWLLAYFQGDVSLVLAAYNAGEGAVEKHRGIPPYNETRDYVKKIIGMYRRLIHPYNSGIVKPSPVISQLRSTM